MQIDRIDDFCKWGLGLLLCAGLAACGAPERGAGQATGPTAFLAPPTTAAPAAATTAPTATVAPTAATAPTPPATSGPTADASTLDVTSPTAVAKETVMPDQPSPPPDSARPTFQVAATPAPDGPPEVEPSPANPIGSAISPPFDPALAALVEGAKADLAQRRSAAIDTIAVVEVRSVTWPDPGLGCPQPGMAYKQVPVDGLLIRLSVGGSVFNYHSGGGKPPFLCEQPAQDKQPAPGPGGGDN